MSDGLDFSGAIYSLDTGNQVFVPAFARGGGFGIAEFTGFPDVVVVPDPGTFRVLPWADRTGWMLCDVYFGNGQPMPLDGRGLLRRVLAELGEAGYDFLAGLEVEFSVVVRSPEELAPENAGFTPPPPPVSVFERGYQFLSEVRLDSMGATLEAMRDALYEVGLPPRSIEDEWGPGQLEFSFAPMAGLAAADAAVLFRSAVKQVCQRRGLLATFMCRPGAAELLLLRLAPAPVAAVPGRRLERVRQRFGRAVRPGPALRGRAARARRCRWRCSGRRRSTATSASARTRSPRTGCAGRWRTAARWSGSRAPPATPAATWRCGSASRPRTPTSTWPRTSRPAWTASSAGWSRRPRPTPTRTRWRRRRCPRRWPRRSTLLDADAFYRKAFGDTLVSYLVMMKRHEIGRYADALAERARPGRPGRQRLGDARVLRVLLGGFHRSTRSRGRRGRAGSRSAGGRPWPARPG